AALGCRHVDDHAAGFHEGDVGCCDQPGRCAPGDERGGDDDVDVGRLLGVDLRRATVVVGAGRLGVAVGGCCDLHVDGQIGAADGVHLVGDLRARVGGAYDGAEAGCGADGGEAR